jgi:hypothetical protein
MRWVKLSKYCELSGDTANAVHSKRKKGQFLDGVHCKIASDGNLWSMWRRWKNGWNREIGRR